MIATEDRRFRHHFGVDPVGLVRALVDNMRAGAVVAGGSTITQQLAKNLYLTPERSLSRKLQELTLAIWLETRLDKDQILALYLNRVYLGAGAYGVEAASRRYFGKGAHDVTLAEAAMLAGLLKAPSALAPTSDLNRARERAAVVLGRMEAEGYITPAQAKAARAKPAKLAPEGETIGAWFVDWVLDGLTDHLGKPERDLVVFTTLDRRVQQATEQAVERTLAKAAVRNRVDEAAAVVLDTSGAVRAMVGGRDHRDGPFNRAVAARRQPGSAFKPFVYLAALEAGWRPGNMIDDRPVRLKDWQPVNFDGKFRGSITLSDAFAHSVNTAAVRLAQTVGPDRVVADRAAAGRGLDHAAGAVDRPGHLGGEPARAHRRLPALRLRRRPPAAVRRDQGRGRCAARCSTATCRPRCAWSRPRPRPACTSCWWPPWRRAPAVPPAAGPHRRRQDRHHPERPRRLVRRLCRRPTSPASGSATTTTGR